MTQGGTKPCGGGGVVAVHSLNMREADEARPSSLLALFSAFGDILEPEIKKEKISSIDSCIKNFSTLFIKEFFN